MKTVQRLNDSQALRTYNFSTLNNVAIDVTTASSGWYIASGPATMVITGDNYYASSHYVIKITATGSAPITLRLDFDEATSPFTSEDIGQRFVFTGVLQCTNGSPSVEAKLCNLSAECNSFNTRTIIGGDWDAIRSNVMTLNSLDYESDAYGITITISNHSPNAGQLSTIYVSTPNLVNDSAWANNPVIQNMRPYIPGLYESYDSQEVDPTWPFFRFVDVLTDAIADTMFLYSEWFQHESSELPANVSKSDLTTRSRLTNYQYVDEQYYPWLSQFSGHRPVKQLYTNDGSAVILDTDSYKTWQLNPAGYGRGAGTQSSIEEAAQFVLTGDKQVVLSQRYDAGDGPSPWNIRITTLASETPDVDYRGTVLVASVSTVDIATGLSDGQVVDGITLSTGDKVLLKNQTTESENGVYEVPASGAASRSSDFDTGWDGSSGEIVYGATFYVEQGTSADKSFSVSTTGNITIGSTSINFEEFLGSEKVLLAVEQSRPMGYKIYHTIVDEFTLTLGSSTFGVLGTATL